MRKRNAGPLRKIVRKYWGEPYPGAGRKTIPMEELECGHAQMEKSDIYGTTHPNSRRCRKCGTEKE